MYRTHHSSSTQFNHWFDKSAAAPRSGEPYPLQVTWNGPTQSTMHDRYFGFPNVNRLSHAIQKAGSFNSAPDPSVLQGCMEREWENQALPYGNIDLVGRRDDSAIITSMNSKVIGSVVKNTREMQRADALFQYDMATFQTGRVGQFDRPRLGVMRRGHVPIEPQMR